MNKQFENRIKKIIFRVFGPKIYLKILNIIFFLLYFSGLLKKNHRFEYHYFVKKLIKKGDIIIDIGANVGYYTKLFARWTGPHGKVYAIEPIKDYLKILDWTTKNYKNVVILPYALGTEEKKIHLVTPGHHGYLRTGRPHIYNHNNRQLTTNHEFVFEAEMRKGSKLLENLKKIDYIKCDIEGYEPYVLKEIKNILIKHRPTLQVETLGKNKPIVENLLKNLGYIQYELYKARLYKNGTLSNKIKNPTHEYIFIHRASGEPLKVVRKP